MRRRRRGTWRERPRLPALIPDPVAGGRLPVPRAPRGRGLLSPRSPRGRGVRGEGAWFASIPLTPGPSPARGEGRKPVPLSPRGREVRGEGVRQENPPSPP